LQMHAIHDHEPVITILILMHGVLLFVAFK
jgi:hypothetical protein